jgi:MFS transporter, ACS family, pantothenate transporter
MGWSVLSGVSGLQLAMVFVIQWLVQREKRQEAAAAAAEEEYLEGDAGHGGNDLGAGTGEVNTAAKIHAAEGSRSSSGGFVVETVQEETKMA